MTPSTVAPTGMKFVQGGDFAMGSEAFYEDERPVRQVAVDDFWIDETPVTNAQFAAFAAETGYVTTAEIPPDPADYPGMPAEMAQPGSIVFVPPAHAVDVRGQPVWWQFVFGAYWKSPLGPGSTIADRDSHPVVHITAADAEAYATHMGKALATEAEWEFAARGGRHGKIFPWGDEFTPGGRRMAKTWAGDFPHRNLAPAGQERTSPVRSYPANGYGLYDMIGNVWEWTADWYNARPLKDKPRCCGAAMRASADPAAPHIPRRVTKGGSHLCAPSYCQRYRPAARFPQSIDTSTSHLGFRCVLRPSHARDE